MRGALLLVILTTSVASAQSGSAPSGSSQDGAPPQNGSPPSGSAPAPQESSSENGDGYDDGEYEKLAAKRLEGTSRISLMGGWRYAPNFKFYDDYYYARDNRDLERARGSIGGPLLTGTFAYSVTELIEVGIDLFATYERMSLTNKPGLNAATYGALVGLRFQKRFELGSQVVIPSVGVLLGPFIAASYFDGSHAVERGSQALGFSGGATLRMSKDWGLCFEFRQIFAGGDVEDVGSYNAGGSWLSVGMTYTIPWEFDDKKIRGRL